MSSGEIVHIAIAPPNTFDENLITSVSNVLNKNIYDTRLIMSGEIPKIAAHCDSEQSAESILSGLKLLGITAIAYRDSEIRRIPQSFKAHTMDFRENEVIVHNSAGHEKKINKNDVFLILTGIFRTTRSTNITKTRTKFSLSSTLLTGGIPVWHKVNEKISNQSTETEYFLRLYYRNPDNAVVIIFQHDMNYSFLGDKIAMSTRANFTSVVTALQEAFPQAIFDDRLAKPLQIPSSPTLTWDDIEIYCRLIYTFHLVSSGYYPA